MCPPGVLVPEWRLLFVRAYVRDFVGRSHRGMRNHEWHLHHTYWVKSWQDVESVYDTYLSIGGTYKRVSFWVDVWAWNVIEGWDYDEQL